MTAITDGQVDARLAGYSWPEIHDHIDRATDTALAAGYDPHEIDGHLGYQDPGILQSKLSLGTPDTPPTISEDAPVDPGVAATYANAVRTGLTTGPQEFAEMLANQWGIDPESRDLLADKLPHPEDTIDHGIALSHMNGDGADGALNAHHNLLDLWAQTGMTPQEVYASRDPLLIDALTKPPVDGPTLQEQEQLPKMPTLAELQTQVGRDAVSHFMGSESDPIGLGGFLKDLYTLPAQRLDFDKETEEMRAAGKDISERWKDDPGLNFLANTIITGGVLKGAHMTAEGAGKIVNHPLIQDILHDESGSVNIGKATELAGEKIKNATEPRQPTDLSNHPDYVRDRITEAFATAQRLGVLDDIESHAANGKTASEIAAELGPKLDRVRDLAKINGELGDAGTAFVRDARNGLGVPSMDQVTEFNTWRQEYLNRQSAKPSPAPEPAEDTVRFYHGWKDENEPTSGGGRWVTTDPRYAEDFRRGAEPNRVSYVDVPKGHPEELAARNWEPADEANGINNVGTYHTFETSEGLAQQMKPFNEQAHQAAAALTTGELTPEQEAELIASVLARSSVKPVVDETVSKLGNAPPDPEPELPLPEGIDRKGITEHVTDLDHQFNSLRSNAAADIGESWKMLSNEPDEWMKPDFLSKVSREVEGRLGHDDPASVKLSPDVQEFLDAHKSLTDKQHALAVEEAELLGRDPSGLRTVDEGHVHRVVKGEENLRGVLDPETYRDPITGARPRTLSRFDPGMKSRADMYVYEDEAGNRTWGRDPLKDTGHQIGDKVEDGLGKYTVKPARMEEIEANTKIRYRDNFLANLVDDVNSRSRVVRNIKLIQAAQPELSEAGLFEPRGSEKPTAGMVKVDLPGMEGYAHPRIANVLNDFYQMAHERGSLMPYLNSATRAIMMSLFLSPMKHLYNEGAHFVPGRGEDWIKGLGPAKYGKQAMQETLGMGPQYMEYLRAGGTPLYVSARTKNFQQVMMTKFFHEQATDAGGLWSGLAKWSGFDTVKSMVQAEYNWSNRTLWAGGEQMRMMLYLERKDQGMSPAEAVASINKDMPSYNIPTEVLLHNKAGHALSEFLKSPYAFVFGRYRYGQIATAAGHVRDLVDPASSLTERRQSAAKIIVTAGMMAGMAKIGQYAGIGTLLHHAWAIATGEERWQDGIGSLMTLGPLLDIANMVHNNIDRTGKEIWRQGGTTLGNVVNAGKHAIGAFPAGQLAEELFKKGGTEKVLLKLLGYDEKTPIDPAKKAAFDQRAKAQALSAERKDDIETWVRNMLGNPLAAASSGTPRATGGYVGSGGGAGSGGGGGRSSQGDGSYSGTGAGRGQRATGSYAGNGSGGTRASGLDSGGVVLRGSGGSPRQAAQQQGDSGGGVVLGDQQQPARTSGGGGRGGRSRAAYYAARRRR